MEPLRLQIQLIDSAMLLLFRSKFRVNILATIEQLRKYMFMGSGYMFHEMTSHLWNGMLSAESADALGQPGQMEKAQWTRSSTRLNGMLNKLSLEHESLLLSSSSCNFRDEGPGTMHVHLLSQLRFKYVVDRTGSKHAREGNARWDSYDSDSYLSIYPTFRLKFPEQIVVTRKSLSEYVGVHRFLFVAKVVTHALQTSWSTLKVSERTRRRGRAGGAGGAGEDKTTRWLHVLRHRAHHVVRSMQEHASMSLHEAWSLFHQQAILGGGGGLGNVTELRCLHDAYVRRMSVSCFIMDDDLRSISHELLRVCLRCSHVVTLSSRENNDHQFELL